MEGLGAKGDNLASLPNRYGKKISVILYNSKETSNLRWTPLTKWSPSL